MTMKNFLNALVAAPILLLAAGCGFTPLDQQMSPLEEVHAPEYLTTPGARMIFVRDCLRSPRNGFGQLPPGCASASISANQVIDRRHLVEPQKPGPAPAGPAGRAANRYIYGDAYLVPGPQLEPQGGYGPGGYVSSPTARDAER